MSFCINRIRGKPPGLSEADGRVEGWTFSINTNCLAAVP
jgi:hypothetical protein